MAYVKSADPDQTAPSTEGAVWSGSTLFSVYYFKKHLHKKQNLGHNSMEYSKF